MVQIGLKRIYDRYDENDGFRVLVDRLWPRGIKKENLKYDEWAKDITPSSGLRKWFHLDPEGAWEKFVSLYTKELQDSQAVQDFITEIKDKPKVTLLYASKNEKQNHAQVLRDFLKKELKD